MQKEKKVCEQKERPGGSPNSGIETYTAPFYTTFDELNGGISTDNHLPLQAVYVSNQHIFSLKYYVTVIYQTLLD